MSDKDIDKLMKAFVTEEKVRTIVQEETREIKEVVKKTFEAVESLVSTKETEKFENAARDAQLTRHDGWIKQVAEETEVKLKD